jgi:hypothetical protein
VIAPETARYERKVPVPGDDWQALALRLKLHPLGFREAYTPRTVRNLYFDTPGLALFAANRDGLGERRKVRVRWYDDALATPTLEVKTRQGSVGLKWQHPLAALPEADLESEAGWARRFAVAELAAPFRGVLAGVRPLLFNWYRRRYYVSADGRFRATIDAGLGYRGVGRLAPAQAAPSVVLEVKYGVEAEPEAYRVLDHLPLRADKHSKYVIGVELCFPERA